MQLRYHPIIIYGADGQRSEKEVTMKATIKKIAQKNIKTQTGKQFTKFVIECDVQVNDKGEIRTYRSEMSMDYAKRYFNFCGVSSKDLIGKECEVTLRKRAYTANDGTPRTITEIKYLNLLNDEGCPIIMPSEGDAKADFGF